MSGQASIVNGKKGGRPTYEASGRIQLNGIELVILTSSQYQTLIEKYGYSLLKYALKILEDWLKTSPNSQKYLGKNNYGHFRSDGWVINSARMVYEKESYL